MNLGFNETKIRIEVFQFVKTQILEILYPENGTEYSFETLVNTKLHDVITQKTLILRQM
jgi:hypothetical protein